MSSVFLLLWRAGFLTREYWNGRRARFVSPIRLYLTFSLLFFAATAMWASEVQLTEGDRTETTTVLGQRAELSGEEMARRTVRTSDLPR